MRIGVSMGVRASVGDKKGTATCVGATLATFRRRSPTWLGNLISDVLLSAMLSSENGIPHFLTNVNMLQRIFCRNGELPLVLCRWCVGLGSVGGPIVAREMGEWEANAGQGCAKTVFADMTMYYVFAYIHTPVFGFEALVRCNATAKVLARLTCERIEQLKTSVSVLNPLLHVRRRIRTLPHPRTSTFQARGLTGNARWTCEGLKTELGSAFRLTKTCTCRGSARGS
jgi:hypothetical protein